MKPKSRFQIEAALAIVVACAKDWDIREVSFPGGKTDVLDHDEFSINDFWDLLGELGIAAPEKRIEIMRVTGEAVRLGLIRWEGKNVEAKYRAGDCRVYRVSKEAFVDPTAAINRLRLIQSNGEVGHAAE